VATMRSREALGSSNNQEFDQALLLIEKLYRALSVADAASQRVNQLEIQEAINFLEKHGSGGPRFE
jgi:hypothetical protein